MNKMSRMTNASPALTLGLFSVMVMLFAVAFVPHSVAESEASNATTNSMSASEAITTTVTPLDDKTSLEKTMMTISIPEGNTLPWAFVDGTIENHAEGNPAIIQFFNEESGDDPMHVAQVDVEEDGSYEYMFRVRDVNLETGEATDIFEGEYSVKIFKVVYSVQDNLNAV